MPASALFDRLGGIDAVKAAVEEFYTRILADEKLAFFFEGTSMAALKAHQLSFMKVAFTEIPEDLDVAALMLEKHDRLFKEKGLNETHFDLVAGHLIGALEHLKVPQDLIDEAIGIVATLRPVFEEGGKLAKESPQKPETLLDRLGGAAAVKAVVGEFYDRILKDDQLATFFNGADMTSLKLHQLKFMEIAFTKIPDDLDVPGLIKEKHAKLFKEGLNETHFDLVAGHFTGALEHLEVPKELIDEAVGVIVPLRPVFEKGAETA